MTTEQDEPYAEPTLKVPAPCPNYVLIVISDGNRFAASEIPRIACNDRVLQALIRSMEQQMEKANADRR